MGYDGVRADRRALSRADRRSPASSRSTCSKASCWTVRQLEAGRAEVENQYARAVRPEGNPASRRADRRRLRGLRPQVARHRPDPAERLPAARPSIATTTPSGSSRSDDIETQESSVCISGQILQGAEEAARLPGVRQGLHAADAAGRDDGLVRRGLCRLLRLRPAPRARAGARIARQARSSQPTIAQMLRRREVDCMARLAESELRHLPAARSRRTTGSLLGHGSGGQLTAELIAAAVRPGVRQRRAGRARRPGDGQPAGRRRHARRRGSPSPPIRSSSGRSSFPGGDIGRLAVHGTVNDLAVGGATPLYLSAAFILEEGLAARRPAAHRRLDARRPATRPASRWSPATPRSSIAARATGLHHHLRHRPRAGGPHAVDPPRPGPATASWSRARSAITASPSCRCARGSSSRPCWKATRAPLARPDASHARGLSRRSAACATRRAAACRAP